MLAFSLARVSTPEQLKNASIGTQFAANHAYGSKHGLTIECEFADDYTGATLDRPAVGAMLARLRAGEARHIIVYALDRLTRDPADFLPLRKEMHERGVTIHVAMEDRALVNDPLTELPDDIKVIVAKHERAVLRERSMRGTRAKVASGKPIGGGPAPYGYTWEGYKRTRTLVVCPDEARIVALIFTWYVIGAGGGPLSVRQIVEQLNAMHIPTRADTSGRTKRTSAYAQWNAGSIRAILRNPIYSGQGFAFRKRATAIGSKKTVLRPRTDWAPIQAPALLEPALVRLAEQKLAIGREQSQRRSRRAYLLRCRIRCSCGFSLSGTSTHGGTRYAYRCISRDRARSRTPCGLPYVPGPKTEAAVWEWLCMRALHPPTLAERLARLHDGQDSIHQAAAAVRQADLVRLAEVERQLASLLDLYLSSRLSHELLNQKHADLEAEQQRLRRVLTTTISTTPSDAAKQDYVRFAEIISAGLEDMTPAEQRRLIDLVDLRLILSHTDGCLQARATCRLSRDAITLFVDASTGLSYSHSEHIEISELINLGVPP